VCVCVCVCVRARARACVRVYACAPFTFKCFFYTCEIVTPF